MEPELQRDYFPGERTGPLPLTALPFAQQMSCHGKITLPVLRVYLRKIPFVLLGFP
ncbi:MAG: hypothetical protein ACTHM5_11040 [Ginsengibacter sp.]